MKLGETCSTQYGETTILDETPWDLGCNFMKLNKNYMKLGETYSTKYGETMILNETSWNMSQK